MKLLCKIVLSGISMIVPLLAQTGLEAPKFSLTISGPQKVALGSNITIEIKLANTSQERLSFVFGQHGALADEYEYDVRDEKGNAVPRVEKRPTVLPNGKILQTPSRAPGSTIMGEIQPGKAELEGATLNYRYRFSHPGVYTVRVSRAPKWSPRVYSNRISINVVQK